MNTSTFAPTQPTYLPPALGFYGQPSALGGQQGFGGQQAFGGQPYFAGQQFLNSQQFEPFGSVAPFSGMTPFGGDAWAPQQQLAQVAPIVVQLLIAAQQQLTAVHQILGQALAPYQRFGPGTDTTYLRGIARPYAMTW